MKNILVWVNLSLACLLLVSAAGVCFGQSYTVSDLGVLPGGLTSSGHGINSSGQVTGVATSGDGKEHAFLYSNGTMKDLGTLPGGKTSVANKINDSGQVTGDATSSDGNSHAFFYSNGVMKDLGVLPTGFSSSGRGINSLGQVAGVSSFQDTSHAFLYSNGTMRDLGTPPGEMGASAGNAINDAGQIAGFADVNFHFHAMLYSNGTWHDLGNFPDLNIEPWDIQNMATAINSSGQVTGYATARDSSNPSRQSIHAFLYSNGTMRDLGTLPGGGLSVGGAINSSGQVVGYSANSEWEDLHPFLYSNGTMQDLNALIPVDSGWILRDASAINDSGQITGRGLINGKEHAFLLTPLTRYKAFVQPPIKADGRSVFNPHRGVLPVKFKLTENHIATCALPPATITVTRTAGGALGTINKGANFRIDPTACQYIYNLAARRLGAGVYRADINIEGRVVGNGVFALMQRSHSAR